MISIWEADTFFAPQDVIIAGGGFVGLWLALYLKKQHPKARITIVDRGVIPTGASTRNAGFACFGSLSEVLTDAAFMGLDKTLELVEMRYKGLRQIEKTFGPSRIDFEHCGGYELFEKGGAKSARRLDEEIAYLNAQLAPITRSKHTYARVDKKIKPFGFGNTAHLVKNNFEGYIHAGKLVQALMQLVISKGVQILTGLHISGFEQNGAGLKLTTSTGIELYAKQLLICTNAFANELLPSLDIVAARGQVLVTSPLKNLPWKGTFHFDEGYYYFRNLGKRVLLGGARNADFEGEQTKTFDTTALIQQKLETFLRTIILPNCNEPFTIDYRWSGIMGMGSEKSPIVKELQPNVFCAVRMSGMGVALAPTVAKTVCKIMLAR